MSELAAMLNQLSIESGAAAPEDDSDHTYIGAEEFTVVTDETTTELEESLADTAEKVEKMQAADTAAEKVAEAVDSLESNLGQLRAMAAAGQPLDHSGLRWYLQNMALAVEARDLPIRLARDEIEALQYSFESNQLTDYTAEAEEKTGNVLTRLWQVLVAAFNAARTAIKQFFGTIGRSADAIVTGGQQLQRLAAKTKGEAKKKEIRAGGYGRLAGEGGLNPAGNIDKALSVFDGDFTTKILDPMKKALSPLTTLMTTGGPVSGDTSSSTLQAKLAGVGLTNTTLELPGGVKAELKADGDKLSFTIGKPAAGPEKAAPLSPSEVSSLGTKLVTLGRRMKLAEAKSEKFIDDAEKVLKAANKGGSKLTDKVGKDNEEKQNRAGVSAAVTAATRIIRAGQGVVPAYTNYLSQLGKDAYNLGKASLGAYGAKAKEAPTAGADGADANKGDDNK